MSEQADYAAEPELTVGWRIQMALDKGGLKHKDLMARFEISRDTVSRWCRDIGPAPKKFILNEIAVMCGVSPRWLIDGPGHAPEGSPDGGGSGDKPVGLLLKMPATGMKASNASSPPEATRPRIASAG